MRRLTIHHRTGYRYGAPVTFHEHRLMLRPREGHDLRIESSGLRIAPSAQVRWHRDVYGNSVATASFDEPADALSIESTVVIQHYGIAPGPMDVSDYAVNFPFQYDASERADVAPYQSPLFAQDDAMLRSWVEQFWVPGHILGTEALLDTLNRGIPACHQYLRREEPGVQSPAQTLGAGSGSCRDLATLLVESCRHLGLAARFVSGYLYAPGLPAAEGATHAWGEVYLPGAGWRGYDPTLGTATGGDHIAVAVCRHPESAPPVRGSFSGMVAQTPLMQVDVSVELAA